MKDEKKEKELQALNDAVHEAFNDKTPEEMEAKTVVKKLLEPKIYCGSSQEKKYDVSDFKMNPEMEEDLANTMKDFKPNSHNSEVKPIGEVETSND